MWLRKRDDEKKFLGTRLLGEEAMKEVLPNT
jgi:hypothetical protein